MIIKCTGDNFCFVLALRQPTILTRDGSPAAGEPGLSSAAGEQGSPCPEGFTPHWGSKGSWTGLQQGLASGIAGAWWEVLPFSRLRLQGCTGRGWEAPVIWGSSAKDNNIFPTYLQENLKALGLNLIRKISVKKTGDNLYYGNLESCFFYTTNKRLVYSWVD